MLTKKKITQRKISPYLGTFYVKHHRINTLFIHDAVTWISPTIICEQKRDILLFTIVSPMVFQQKPGFKC